MTQTERFIQRLETLKDGERSRLRRLVGKPLDETLPGFDLFTGLWWPLRQKSPASPRRETSWLIAKLYGAFSIPHVRPDDRLECPILPRVMGWCEPRDEHDLRRFRERFEALLCSPLSALESHLCWALSVAVDAVEKKRCTGLDWAQLLEDLSIWDRGEEHLRGIDVREEWASQYLNAANGKEEHPC